LRLDSLQALKVMRVTTLSFQNRLLQEGRGQAGLRNPNVVSVFDVLDIDGAPALLMEYVAGPTLGALIKHRRFTVPEALWLFRGIVLGVGAAHRRGLVHRDLKPDNVLLAPTNDGLVPKVTDFGLVKFANHDVSASQLGRAIGTAPYMAPEQVSGAPDIDQRTDLWALGCILYELIAGRRAFSGTNALDTFNRIRNGDYVPLEERCPDTPQVVLDSVSQMLTASREDRIRSTDQLFELLFDGGLDTKRVELSEDMCEELEVLTSSESTAETDIAPHVRVRTSEMRIAPLGPDMTQSLETIPGHYPRSHQPNLITKDHANNTQQKVLLKPMLWIPMTTATVAIVATITVFALLFSGAALSSPPTSQASMPQHGDSP
jgi:serine/threonine protein kinase